MSLDVYLRMPGKKLPTYSSGIFIRRNGSTEEITREEWNKLHPGQEPVSLPEVEEESDVVFEYNITHNLTRMADKAGIYKALWRPEEINITTAQALYPLLKTGLDKLLENPDLFKGFNPSNGWGSYDGLVDFVVKYMVACKEYPEAIISVSR